MTSAAWMYESHFIMTTYGTLYVINILLLIATYYWLHRKGVAFRLLARSASQDSSLNRNDATFTGGAVTIILLLLPLAFINVATKVAMHVAYCHYKGTGLEWTAWAAQNWLSWLWSSVVVACAGVICVALAELTIRNEIILAPAKAKARFILLRLGVRPGTTAAAFGRRVLTLRRQVATRAPYRLWFLIVTACTLLVFIQLLMRANPLSGEGRVELVPDSPRKQSILNLARQAGVTQIDLLIRHTPNNEVQMNAWGVHRSVGARIEYSASYWDNQDDAAVLETTGHELFHVLHGNHYQIQAIICLSAAILTCLLIGFPKKVPNAGRNPITRIPVYVLILISLWPAVQATRNALKRPNEAEADMYAIRLAVGNKIISLEQAKGSLLRSHEYNSTDPDPAWLIKVLLYDHPPLVERLHNMDEAAKQVQIETVRK